MISNLFKKYIRKTFNNYEILLRKKSVDLEVFDYVFLEKYHRPYQEIAAKNPVILDLGSNIGLTIIDLKFIYPNSRIYGYELDKDNFDLANKNCKLLSDCFIYNLAVWSETTQIRYSKGSNVDAYKVEANIESKNGVINANSITINQIIKQHLIEVIDYVKMDIEGAEFEVFQKNLEWLAVTKQIKIEVHYDKRIFDFLRDRLDEYGFITIKDTHHWSTLIGYKNEG